MDRRIGAVIAVALWVLVAEPSFVAAQTGSLGVPEQGTPPSNTIPEANISPNTGMPQLNSATPQRVFQITELALNSGDYVDPRYVTNSRYPDDPGIWKGACIAAERHNLRIPMDFKNFYLSENLLCVGAAVMVAAPLANTHADQGIQDWYQRGAGKGHSHSLDTTARVFEQFGDYRITIPAYFVFMMGEPLFPYNPLAVGVSEFGHRAWRALAVGAPMIALLQSGLGAERPSARDSHWHPFHSTHGASGHAFVGSIPFLMAASMVESTPIQTLLFVSSMGPAWSRIHQDRHYFSQAMLGWAIGYLAVTAVNRTENYHDANVRITPIAIPNGAGMGVVFQY